MSKKAERIALFVDAANMFYAQRELGWHLDYIKVYRWLTNSYEVYNAFYYTGKKRSDDQEQEEKEQRFIKALSYSGYTVRTKDVKRFVDRETGAEDEKCNLDIEIVIDMFNTVDNYDVAILCSGDGDFVRAIELLRSKGKQIHVVSTKGMIAGELINAADKYFDLKDLRNIIEKIKSPK